MQFMKYFLSSVFILLSLAVLSQKNASISFEKWISLKGVGGPLISPDGKTVIYSVGTTDWANNTYDNEYWMSRDSQPPVQLTRTNKGSSFNGRFSPSDFYNRS